MSKKKAVKAGLAKLIATIFKNNAGQEYEQACDSGEINTSRR